MNIFDLAAKITLDSSEYESGLDKAKKGFSVAGKAIGAAVATAGAAVTAIGKQAVDSYANYEQLVGGVETLFNNSADVVQQYAANAYQTAGLSANEYMETVTSFSASLLQSLDGDTKAAADAADMAIRDMSDNANKMGTSMESIQYAYQGFAKQNYTMLDNLKLGYGGTKEEMERLLADAEKLSGVKYDISSLSDVYEAIHVVQTELGITGTTALEASSTISGSLASMKSAWENLLVGVADENSNFEVLVENFVDSVGTVGENIIPRVEQSIMGIGALIERLSPIIAEKVPEIVGNVLPNILNAASTLVTGFIDSLVSLLPTVVESGGEVLMSLIQGIVDNAPNIIDGVIAAIMAFVDFVTGNLPAIVESGVQIIVQLAAGLIKAIPQLVSKLPQLITAIVNGIKSGISQIVTVGKSIVDGVWSGIQAKAAEFTAKVKNFFARIVNTVKKSLGIHSPSTVFAGIGENMALGLGKGWDKEYNDIEKDIESGLNFDSGNVKIAKPNYGQNGMYYGSGLAEAAQDIVLNITNVLDGKAIGETAYRYSLNRQRAYGV